MDDLVTWLRAQLDDDESAAQAAADYSAKRGYSFPTDGSGTYNMLAYEHEQHATRHNPTRVLAELAAKRRILDAYDQTEFGDFSRRSALEEAITALALPYADRSGYREEWAPDA